MKRLSIVAVIAAVVSLLGQPAQAAGEFPSSVREVTVSARAANQVTLSWLAPTYEGLTPVDSYNVYFKPSIEPLWTLAQSVVVPTTSATITGLVSGVSYQFKVAAVNAAGEGMAGTYGELLDLSLGSNFSCAIRGDKSVWCWGANDLGQFGSGDGVSSPSPVHVSGLDGVDSISAGPNFACAIKAGQVWCFGDNTFGQLGDGTTTASLSPVAAFGIPEAVVSIDAGSASVCAVTVSGDLYCWGDNTNALLGDGGNISSQVPKRVLTGVANVSVGQLHACALLQGAIVSCWGSESLTPTEITSVPNARDVSVGGVFDSHGDMCAITSTREVSCWSSITSPIVPVVGPTSVVQLSVGLLHACALTATGNAWCWGTNTDGQLGNASVLPGITTVNGVPALSRVIVGGDASTGYTCGATPTGALYCWGANASGQIGNGTYFTSLLPAMVPGFATQNARAAVAPSAVSGVTFISRTESSITLSWNALTAAEADGIALDSYVIETSLDGATWNQTVVAAGSTSATVSGLTAANTYLVRVAGVTAAGTGSFSNAVSMRTSLTPDPVTGLTFVSRSGTSVTVSWTEPAADGLPVLSYKVEWATGAGAWQSATVVGATNYTITNLAAATSYRIRVSATSVAGTGLPSAELTDRTSNPPDAVTGLAFVSRSNSSVSVSWAEPLADGLPVLYYKVEWATGVGSWQSATVVGATSYTITGLAAATSYRIRVSAASSAGIGLPSAELTDRTSNPPDVVTGLAHVDRTESSISVSWAQPAADGLAIVSYEVQWFLGAATEPTRKVVTAPATSTTITGLVPGSTYRIRVVANSAAGAGPASAELTDRTLNPPSAVSGIANAGRTGTSISLTWVAPDADTLTVLDYKVEWALVGGAWASKVVAGTSTTIDGLLGNTDYSIRISARSAAGLGTASAEWLDHTLRAPAKVTGITHVGRTDTSIEVSWTTPASDGLPITQIKLEWSRDGINWPSKFLTGAQAALTQWNITSLRPNSAYQIRITATSSAGTGVVSDLFADRTSHEPAQVTGVAFVGRTAKTISLSWLRPDSDGLTISGYKIEASTDGINWTSQLIAGDVTSGTIAGLTPNATYRLRVSATNPAGTSVPSAELVDRTSHAPDAVGAINVTAKSSSSISLSWAPPASDGSPLKYYLVEYSENGLAWNSFSVQNASALVTNLLAGSSYYVRVVAVSDAGSSVASAAAVVSTSGQRSGAVTVVDSTGKPLVGGTLSWRMADNSAQSSTPMTLNSAGQFELANVNPGDVVFSLANAEMSNGTRVSGEFTLWFGFSTARVTLPAAPAIVSRTMSIKLPSGRPVVGAKVSISHLSRDVTIDGVTFSTNAVVDSGVSDSQGKVEFLGFATSAPVVSASYFDGLKKVTATADASGATTVVTMSDATWVKSSFNTKTVGLGDRVEVVVSALTTAGPRAGIAVKLLAPQGASQTGCGAVLKGVTNAAGKVKLYVCATKSGSYKLSAVGAVVTSTVTLLVTGAPPMPVTRLTVKSVEARILTISWLSPQFSGGSKISEYRVVAVGGGKTIRRTLTGANVILRGLTSGVSYVVTVVAKSGSGLSDAATSTVVVL